MKKIFVLLFLFCLLQMSFAGALPSAKAADAGMHINSIALQPVTATSFLVSGTFDASQSNISCTLSVSITGFPAKTYNFTASGTTWGPVTVSTVDFPGIVTDGSQTYVVTLAAIGLATPVPVMADPMHINWKPAGATVKIIASASSGGTITPSGTVAVKKGEDMKFIITPDNGHKIADVKVDGVSAGAVSSYTFQNLAANHTIEAAFEINTYTINASAEEGGLITPPGTITINYGESKTFQITSDQDYEIKDVLVDGKSVGVVSSYTFPNITSNHSIQATFVKQSISITIVLQIGNPNIKVNNEARSIDEQGTKPVIKNNRTLVPIRAIVEALGGTIAWDGTERKVTITLKNTTIELWIGKNAAKVNGINTLIDSSNPKVVPEIINSRTMLPLRFVTENLGCNIQWDGMTKTITIKYGG